MGPIVSTPAGSVGISSFHSVRCPVRTSSRIHARRQFARLIDIQRAPSVLKLGLFARIQSRQRTRITAAHRIKISLLIWTDPCHPLRIGRNYERRAAHAFGRDGISFSRSNIAHIKADSLARLVRRKQKSLANFGNHFAQEWLTLSLVRSFGSPAPVVSSLSCDGVS